MTQPLEDAWIMKNKNVAEYIAILFSVMAH